ncbi:MAG: aminodeoxychorismate/anthranilate synthase component II [Flavobacteriaceae bacterium]|nr:aminodeoxychorismate/anthranilate synthase component II [Flavobacteriaceae bacterium]
MKPLKIVVIDNYDSFTYNLVHILEDLETEVTILRNDQFYIEDLKVFDKIAISPGPGIPSEAGLTKEVITTFAGKIPILGICLGHQAIAECFGGQLENLPEVYHGISTKISIKKDYIFKGCPSTIKVGRYHSWAVAKNLPEILESIATDNHQINMAFRHKTLDIRGLQFHPESILTPLGFEIIKNWVLYKA